jgi:signal transduction histidine kinase
VPALSSGIKEVTAAIAAAGDTAAALRERQDEIDKLHGELRAQNERLSEADRRKDEFLATLAHELRNPLAPIRTAAELLKHPGLAPQDAARAREIIERQAQHMTRMVDDLMELGRITHGELQLRKEPVALADAVRWALEAARPLLDQAGIALTLELPEAPLYAPLYLRADPTRLVQILTNLLGNAAKFTPRGGHAWLRARRDGDWIEVSVRDDGIGIEPGQIPRLFEMFSQAQPALERGGGGLGIGLALVRGLVERHGGTVEAKSAGPGRGAEFIVRLPAAEAPREAAEAPSRGSTGKKRVLVADDNRDAADSLGFLLRAMGHEVRIAYDGEQALAAGAEFRPDALILDIGMPRANGYDVAARARESDWGRGATLIALTGWGQRRDKALAARAGFDYHLTKPVEAAALEALLG